MWSPPLHQLDAAHAPSVFMLSAWHELLDPFTPDTFQPRLHNVASLVHELADVSSRLDESTVWWKHANSLRHELLAVADEEHDLLQSLPEYQWHLQRIKAAQSRHTLRLACRLLDRRRPEYDDALRRSILQSAAGLPQQKNAAYKALRRLATLAIQASKDDSDFEIAPALVDAPAADVLQWLVDTTLGNEQAFRCVFAVVGEQRHIQTVVRRVGFRLLPEHSLPNDAVLQLQCAYGSVYFVEIVVNGRSMRNAMARARNTLSMAADTFNLYSNAEAIGIANPAFAKLDGGAAYVAVSQTQQAFRRLYARSRAARDSGETLELVSQKRLDGRVLNALQLHSLALSSAEPRVKLVNLWSALECLAGCCEHESVIERVLHLVVPLLVWRRVDKVVRYTSIAVKQLADLKTNWQYGPGFPRSKENFVHPWDMMVTLCRPQQHADIVSLLGFCSPHPLLCFRVFRLWESFHDPSALRKELLKSRDRLEWQLRRIYRARNALVHDGKEVKLFGPLLDNLQYYSSVVIQRIIHGMKLNEGWGVRESLEYWNAKSDYVLDSLDEHPGRLRASDFFPFKAPSDAPHIWE